MKLRFFCCALLLSALLPRSLPAQTRVVRVGVVVDGPWSRNDEIAEMTRHEILTLTRGEFDVRFPADKMLTADWTLAGVQAALERLLADPEVDIILTMGVVASSEAARRGPLPKPVIAPFVIDAGMQGLPSHDGVSGVANLNYLSLPSHVARDIKIFQEIVPFSTVTVLLNHLVYESIPLLSSRIKSALREQNVNAVIVPVRKTLDSTLEALSGPVEAVYVAPLLHISSADFDRLVKALNDRKIPTFSHMGVREVERGLMATASPEFFPKLTRRIALNFQRILLGEKPETLPVSFAVGERLTINIGVARAIGVSPPFSVLTEAQLINETRPARARQLSLTGVMREAIDKNLDLLAERKQVAAGEREVQLAEAVLLPQISVSSTGLLIDKDRAEASFGAQAQRSLTGSLKASQLIFSEKAWANRSIQRHLQALREHILDRLRLDIGQEAATAFLNVLRAKTLESVSKENLRRTRSNLELAQVRAEIGASGRSEVFRWENEIARDRIEVIDANARRNVAEIAVNRILRRPAEEAFIAVDVQLNDPALATSRPEVMAFLKDPVSFKRLRAFMVEEGLAVSPEIAALEAAIAAKKRELASAKWAFWSPTLALQGEVSQLFNEGGLGAGDFKAPPGLPLVFPQADNTSWSLALNLSLPLFEGSGRFARKARASRELKALEFDRESTRDKIEQRIRSALHMAGSSSAAIKLSRDAADAANKNLDLVTDAYSRGALNILDLLDAQNAALNAELGAENAVYDFLVDLMEVERSAGKFYFFATQEERDAWIRRLRAGQ